MFVRICRTFSTIRMIRVLIQDKPSKARRKQEGFTLLELILVMVLLTGVMAVVAPSLSGFFRSAALDEEGRRMLSVIEMTRREAIANGFPTQLWLDAEKGLYGMRELQGVQADVLPGVDEKKPLGKRIYRMPPELVMELNDTSFLPPPLPVLYTIRTGSWTYPVFSDFSSKTSARKIKKSKSLDRSMG